MDGTNKQTTGRISKKIASSIPNLGLSVKYEKTMVYISSFVIRNDKLDKKQKEVNYFIKQQCFTNEKLSAPQ